MDIKDAKKKLAATLIEIKAAGFTITYDDRFGIQIKESCEKTKVKTDNAS